jgi:hypothetical protein
MPTYTRYRKGSAPGTAIASGDTDLGPSPNLWRDIPDYWWTTPEKGIGFFDDFIQGTTTAEGGDHEWVIAAAVAGTAADITSTAGIVALDSASSTADQGITQFQAYRGTTTIPFKPAATQKIIFETRLAIGDGAVSYTQMFAGLSEIDTTIFATGANTSTNHLGFEMNALTQAGTVGTAGYANFYGEKAGTRNTAAANVGLDVHLFTDAGTGGAAEFTTGWVKLGFIVDGITNCKVYVNGIYTGDIIPTANVPIVGMVPSFACLSEGTADPIMQIDWVRVFLTRPNVL